jgi:prepilin-type N-terminal cleavage/methylation domain-containing protein
MRQSLSSWGGGQVAQIERGFTLIEMMVVVGIISALATVTTPNIIKLIDQAESGAQQAEKQSVKTALHVMMADQGISTIISLSGGTSVNNWASLPAGNGISPLTNYLGSQTTTYFYCYDANGNVTRQDVVATASCP